MANFNLNKVILGGRLTGDPVLKVTPTGVQVCNFAVAVNRRFTDKATGKSEADFFNCTAWRQTAEFVSRYFRKASSICVVGSIQTREWVDQTGQKRFATEIVVDEACFVDAKSEMPPMQAAQGTYAPAQGTYIPQDYMTMPPAMDGVDLSTPVDDGELPF